MPPKRKSKPNEKNVSNKATGADSEVDADSTDDESEAKKPKTAHAPTAATPTRPDSLRRHSCCYQAGQAIRAQEDDLVVALWNVQDFGAGPSGMWARPQLDPTPAKSAASRLDFEIWRPQCDTWLANVAPPKKRDEGGTAAAASAYASISDMVRAAHDAQSATSAPDGLLEDDIEWQRASDASITRMLRKQRIPGLVGLTTAKVRYAWWHQRVRDVEHHCAATGADIVVILEAKTSGKTSAVLNRGTLQALDVLAYAAWVQDTLQALPEHLPRLRSARHESNEVRLARKAAGFNRLKLFNALVCENDEKKIDWAFNLGVHTDPEFGETVLSAKAAKSPETAKKFLSKWTELIDKTLYPQGSRARHLPSSQMDLEVIDWIDAALLDELSLYVAEKERREDERKRQAARLAEAQQAAAVAAAAPAASASHPVSSQESEDDETEVEQTNASDTADAPMAAAAALPSPGVAAPGAHQGPDDDDRLGLRDLSDAALEKLITIRARAWGYRSACPNCNIEEVATDNHGLAKDLHAILQATAEAHCPIPGEIQWTFDEKFQKEGETVLVRCTNGWEIDIASTEMINLKKGERPAWVFEVRHKSKSDNGSVTIFALHAPAPTRIDDAEPWFNKLLKSAKDKALQGPVIVMGDFNTKQVHPDKRSPAFYNFVEKFYANFHPPYEAKPKKGVKTADTGHGTYLTSVKKSGGPHGWSEPYDKILTFKDMRHFKHSMFRRSHAFELNAPAARRYSDHSYLIRNLQFSEQYMESRKQTGSTASATAAAAATADKSEEHGRGLSG